MPTKPAITFITTSTNANLIFTTRTILSGMTDNPNYATPSPTLAAVTTALDEFSTACANAIYGGTVLTAIKNARRAALSTLLRNLASYVQVTCNGDLTVLLSSGFPIQKPQRQPIGDLPKPGNIKLSLGAHTGELDALMPPIFGAAIYNWQLTRADAPTVVLQSAQTTAASKIFTGLTPGVVYAVQANAVNNAGTSDWSNPVAQMVV